MNRDLLSYLAASVWRRDPNPAQRKHFRCQIQWQNLGYQCVAMLPRTCSIQFRCRDFRILVEWGPAPFAMKEAVMLDSNAALFDRSWTGRQDVILIRWGAQRDDQVDIEACARC